MKKRKIIGLQQKKVKLLAYNTAWPRLYKREEKLLLSVAREYILDIQHIGSTSVPGMKAKPIIDIVIGVKSLKDGKKCVGGLEKIGYEYKHDAGVKGRHFFVKGTEKNRTHYIHIVKLNGNNWENYIYFRDYLRAHKIAVIKYNKLKEQLAKKYKHDRDTYTTRKSFFIQGIIKKAKT